MKIMMSEASEITKNFDPNGVFPSGRLFGLPFTEKESKMVVIPVPFEATVSFRSGTVRGPQSVLSASPQIDLFDRIFPEAWKEGIFMRPISDQIQNLNSLGRKKSEKLINYLEKGNSLPKEKKHLEEWEEVDEICEEVHFLVKKQAQEILKNDKIPAVLGGEHSVALGLILALSEKYSDFGILQIDAHLDLRDGYEGFRFSHAAAMRRASEVKGVKKIINVGARDFCQDEIDFMEDSDGKCQAFTDHAITQELFSGNNWKNICDQIISDLPDNVYVSFDADGLDPSLCPDTGTPVPGGLQYDQALYLIEGIVTTGKKIIGFDLTEVAPNKNSRDLSQDWNAIAGSRILYRLSILAIGSQAR